MRLPPFYAIYKGNMKRYQKNKFEELVVLRSDTNMDKACDQASELVRLYTGADDKGYLTNVEGNDRTTDSLYIEFVSLNWILGGSYNYQYHFRWCVKCEPDEDEEDEDEEGGG